MRLWNPLRSLNCTSLVVKARESLAHLMQDMGFEEKVECNHLHPRLEARIRSFLVHQGWGGFRFFTIEANGTHPVVRGMSCIDVGGQRREFIYGKDLQLHNIAT